MKIDVKNFETVVADLTSAIKGGADESYCTIGRVNGVWFRLTAMSNSSAIEEDSDEVAPGDLCLLDGGGALNESDNRRLVWLMNEAQIDGAEGMDDDRYSLACKLAAERGREAPNEQDEADGCRAVIDYCMVYQDAN